MNFFDRLRECRYISPSGIEHVPLFDSLERSGGKKASIHEMPHRDTADVQEFGNEAERIPMSLYFIGENCDLAADAFYAALREPGRAKLKHPRWGDIDVLPLTRSQTENLIDEIWCAKIQVEFVEAPDPKSLVVTTTTAAAIQSAAELEAAEASEAAAEQMEVTDIIESAQVQAKTLDRVAAALDKLKAMTVTMDEMRSQVVAKGREIERNISELVNTPLELANSFYALMRAPALAGTSIISKVTGYASLIASGIADLVSDLIPAVQATAAMDILGTTIALAECTTAGILLSRSEAISAYDMLTDSAEDVYSAIEGLTGYVQDPEVLARVRQLVTDARARLLMESYSLPTERTMVLDGDSTPIHLSYELYGDPERFGDIIDQNQLTGESILVIPRGMEIRFYE